MSNKVSEQNPNDENVFQFLIDLFSIKHRYIGIFFKTSYFSKNMLQNASIAGYGVAFGLLVFLKP